MPAVPALIESLTDIHDRYFTAGTLVAQQIEAEQIVDALCRITGENPYGSPRVDSPAFWDQWWETHGQA